MKKNKKNFVELLREYLKQENNCKKNHFSQLKNRKNRHYNKEKKGNVNEI